jgi:hypothetical protein
MARLIVPSRANNSQTSIDGTLPMTCVIESSYVVNGHGVRNKNSITKYLIVFRNILFE